MLFHQDLLKYHLHKVEDTLYKLFGELLSSDSVIFKQMLVSGPDSAVSDEGFSDDNPIHIRDLYLICLLNTISEGQSVSISCHDTRLTHDISDRILKANTTIRS